MAKKEQKKLTANERSIGLAMDRMAGQYATMIAPLAMPTIDRLNAARQEWEGGAFAVMFKVTTGLEPEHLAALPDPKQDDGNNPGKYWTVIVRDNKEKVEEHDFYEEVVHSFPGIRLRGQRIDQLKRSMMDPAKVNTSDIGADIMNMSPDYRHAEIKRLEKEISGAVTKVQNAFGLYHQFRRFETLKHVTCSIIHKLGPDNLPMDGKDGRAWEVDPTTTPIVITSTVAGRAAIDTVRVGITTFLKYDVEKAKENGGTYQALLDTAKRQKADDNGNQNAGNQSVPQYIRTSDTFLARATDMFEAADFAWEEKDGALMDALRKAITGDGSDDNFSSVMGLKRFLNDICPDSPRNMTRYKELTDAKNGDAKAVA